MPRFILFLFLTLPFLSTAFGQPSPKKPVANTKYIYQSILDEIVNYYKRKCEKISLSQEGETLYISGTLEEDNRMGIEVSRLKKSYLLGDINGDNTEDVIGAVHTEGPGNSYSTDYFVFTRDKGVFTLREVTYEYEMGVSGNCSLNQIKDGIVYGTTLDWHETDSRAYPTLKYAIKLKFVKGKLQLINKKYLGRIE